MPIDVYRCTHCGREVLVRASRPLTDREIRRRIEDEMQPAARGTRGERDFSTRLRDYIWQGLSDTREMVPRDELPERCPACCRPTTLEVSRTIDR